MAEQTPATTTQPATGPAATSPASQPATSQAAVDPVVDRILDETEQAGKLFGTLKADVEFVEEQLLFAEKKTFLGNIYYQKAPQDKDTRFRIHFDFIRGRAKVKADRDVSFFSDREGRWLVTRDGDIKQWRKYQVARPGEAFDPLKLGKGPFPVPFGQEKAEVLRLFRVSTRPTADKDPEGARYLLLIPGPEAARDLNVRQVEMWVGPEGLPVRIRTEDPEGLVAKTATFSRMEKNPKLPDRVFELPEPARDWDVQVERLDRPGGGLSP